MVASSDIGRTFGPVRAPIEAGQLRRFALAIGEQDRTFHDMEAARRAGHPALPAPLTYSFCLEMDREDPFDYLRELNIDLASVLHAEQEFRYHRVLHAGDLVTFTSRVADVFTKKGGALTFVVLARTAHLVDGTLALESRTTLIVREQSRP